MAETISPDFPFAPNFVEVKGSKMHYVDVGEGEPVLFLHGNPTSSYLWRNIIPHVSPHARCIAPDLIGMGKSDKPDLEYRFVDHAQYVDGFIEAMGLKNITLVIHDWGSGLGFHYARRHEGNVRAIAFMEAFMAPLPSWDMFPETMRPIFQQFRTPEVGWDMIVKNHMFVEQILPGAIVRKMTDAEMNHYRAPYTDVPTRKPLWRWPNEIPVEGHPADVAEIVGQYNAWLQKTPLPKLMFTCEPGALMPPPVVEWCKANLPNLQSVDLGEGIHFVQEDHPHKIGTEIARWYKAL